MNIIKLNFMATWIWTLMIALPMVVALKNVANGIKKWPQVIPAKSKSGFGIDAHNNTVKNACFYNWL